MPCSTKTLATSASQRRRAARGAKSRYTPNSLQVRGTPPAAAQALGRRPQAADVLGIHRVVQPSRALDPVRRPVRTLVGQGQRVVDVDVVDHVVVLRRGHLEQTRDLRVAISRGNDRVFRSNRTDRPDRTAEDLYPPSGGADAR